MFWDFQALNMVTLKHFFEFVAGEYQWSTQTYSRTTELVQAPKYLAQIFRTGFVKRPQSRLVSAFQPNVDTLNSKNCCDRAPKQVQFTVDIFTDIPQKTEGARVPMCIKVYYRCIDIRVHNM